MLIFLLTFVCGALYESCCIFWVHFAEKQRAGIAAFWSMMVAVVTIAGTEQFLQSDWNKVAYVLGFGAGTHAAISLKKWRASTRGHSPALTHYLRMQEDLHKLRELHGGRESIGEDRLLNSMDEAWMQLTPRDIELLNAIPAHSRSV